MYSYAGKQQRRSGTQRTRSLSIASPLDRLAVRQKAEAAPRSNDRSKHDVHAAVYVCVKDSAKVYSDSFGAQLIDIDHSKSDDKECNAIGADSVHVEFRSLKL